MKKIWQKSLASMVSAALCLTAFVGCLTVNAATTYNGKITSDGVAVETTATEATVKLTISADVDMAAAGITVTNFLLPTGNEGLYKLVPPADGAFNRANGTVIVEAKDQKDYPFNNAEVTLTFTKNKELTLNENDSFAVNVTPLKNSTIPAATYNEDEIYFDVDNINITVKSSHTHTWGAGVMTTMPTTTSNGVITYTCGCGATKQEAFSVSGTITTNTSKTSEDVDKVKVQYGAKFNSAVFADIQANGGTVTAIGMLFTRNGSDLDFSNEATKPVYEYTSTIPSGASPTLYYYYQGMPFSQMSDSLTFRPYVKYTNSEGTVSYEYGDTVSFVYIDLLASLASDNAYAIELLNYYNEYVVK